MDELYHYGVKGMHWGVRRYQNYDGTRIKSGDTVFVSGSSKTQSKDSGYYRKKLPRKVRHELKTHMKAGNKIIVGDAPGIDRQTQDYLNKKKYSNVEIYGPGDKVRYSANKEWKTNPINDKRTKEGSKAWLAAKDKAMAKAATKGLAVTLDEGAKATRKNVDRLVNNNKDVKVYQLSKEGKHKDTWDERTKRANKYDKTTKDVNDIVDSMNVQDKNKVLGGGSKPEDRYIPTEQSRLYSMNLANRSLKKVGKTPVAFMDIWDDQDAYQVAIGTRSGDKYRGKGYATKCAKKGMKWIDKNWDKLKHTQVLWGVKSDNAASIAIAKKLGFTYQKGSKANGWETYEYTKLKSKR